MTVNLKNLNNLSESLNNTISIDYGIYTGIIKDGLPHGRGKLIYKLIYTGLWNGAIYEGDFKNGESDGKDIYFHKNGNIYEEDLKKDKATGKGLFYYNDGKRYEGDFKKDASHGKGVFYYINGDRMMGNYYKDKPVGKFVILCSNGTKCQKQF